MVDREVISKQKELLIDTLLGVLKSRMMYMRRAVPQKEGARQFGPSDIKQNYL